MFFTFSEENICLNFNVSTCCIRSKNYFTTSGLCSIFLTTPKNRMSTPTVPPRSYFELGARRVLANVTSHSHWLSLSTSVVGTSTLIGFLRKFVTRFKVQIWALVRDLNSDVVSAVLKIAVPWRRGVFTHQNGWSRWVKLRGQCMS